MSRRNRYPKTVDSWCQRHHRRFFKSCRVCNRVFGKHEWFLVRETQVSWFRGDDEVTAACYDCATTVWGVTRIPHKVIKQEVVK